ncbi:hypothetical protein [Solibacillus cecembensis]|uniref:hypothetical protein n=1 Tax=Solibacillus cecembensis TaxID=459347 RepID=UPI003D00AE27
MIGIIGMVLAFIGTMVTGMSVLIVKGRVSEKGLTWGDLENTNTKESKVMNWTILGLIFAIAGFILQFLDIISKYLK